MIWHFLRRHRVFCDKIEESTQQVKMNKTDSIRRDVELIARDAAVIRENLTEKVGLIVRGV